METNQNAPAGGQRQSLDYEKVEPEHKWLTENGQDVLTFHVPGFRKHQLNVKYNPGMLTISGDRAVDQSKRMQFRKQIKISRKCYANEIRAKLIGDNLRITMPPSTKVNEQLSNYRMRLRALAQRLHFDTAVAKKVILAAAAATALSVGAYLAYRFLHRPHHHLQG